MSRFVRVTRFSEDFDAPRPLWVNLDEVLLLERRADNRMTTLRFKDQERESLVVQVPPDVILNQ